MIDLGASFGAAVKEYRLQGFDAWGVDGTEGIEELTSGLVSCADLTKDSSRQLYGTADWATFIEVGEHVPPCFEEALVNNVSRIPRRGLVVSWASLTREVRTFVGHVNCATIDYVRGLFVDRGWEYRGRKTRIILRALPPLIRRKRDILVFTRGTS